MTTATRAPTSDEAVSGTWTGSAGTRYQAVDDYPDSSGADFLTHGTTAGNLTFGFSAFAIPAGASSISVAVQYYDRKNASQSCNIGGRLKVGGSYFNATTHNPANGTITQRTDSWATNPKSAAAWTVDDINGVGGNALQAFGWVSTDASPAIDLTSIQLAVTYTDPISGSVAVALSAESAAIAGAETMAGAAAPLLPALSAAATASEGFAGTSSAALASIQFDAAGDVAGGSDISGAAAPALTSPSLSVAGRQEFAGAAVVALVAPVLAAAALEQIAGTAAPAGPAALTALAGAEIFSAAAAAGLAAITTASSAREEFWGSGAVTLPAASESSAGAITAAAAISGAGAILLRAASFYGESYPPSGRVRAIGGRSSHAPRGNRTGAPAAAPTYGLSGTRRFEA